MQLSRKSTLRLLTGLRKTLCYMLSWLLFTYALLAILTPPYQVFTVQISDTRLMIVIAWATLMFLLASFEQLQEFSVFGLSGKLTRKLNQVENVFSRLQHTAALLAKNNLRMTTLQSLPPAESRKIITDMEDLVVSLELPDDQKFDVLNEAHFFNLLGLIRHVEAAWHREILNKTPLDSNHPQAQNADRLFTEFNSFIDTGDLSKAAETIGAIIQSDDAFLNDQEKQRILAGPDMRNLKDFIATFQLPDDVKEFASIASDRHRPARRIRRPAR